MKHRMRTPSPALVISLLALFVALGGTAYAAASLPKNSVGAKQLKKNAVRTAKIKNGAVRTAKIKNGAVKTAKIKNGAITAAKINTSGLTAHVVGAAGQPAYENGWTVPTASADEALSFYKDPFGIVHIQGNTSHSGTTTAAVFTLPAGYRPAKNLYFAVYGAAGTPAFMVVDSNGTVDVFGSAQSFLGLTNITFRAGL